VTVIPARNAVEIASGAYLDVTDPDPSVITVEVVAHALANTCRFGGHTRRFYSVAEHACLVAARVANEGGSPGLQLLVGDVPRPIRLLVPKFREIEGRIDTAVRDALKLPHASDGDNARIQAADDWALACEAHWLLPSKGEGWAGEYGYDPGAQATNWEDMLGLTPEGAKRLYLQTHEHLEAVVAA
jgi:hypothetical protein